ncbi:hypothetical protein SDC9_183437 [bioreactor metagenome]|uniref:Thioredoxin domain-containing protein n=1 Tax=bioreactor metagenome TaxID=1076179 RepID=A0A645HC35_9ZZZZ|nr:hypothetical protein [Erysipelotrichaceae bacterium]
MKKSLNWVLTILLILNLFVSSAVLYIIWQRKATIASNEETKTSLNELYYYQEHQFTDFDRNQKDFLLYIHSNSCMACQDSDAILKTFINYGYTGVIDIYFLDLANDYDLNIESLITAKGYQINVTPALLHFTSGGLVEVGEGTEAIYDMLDEIVQSAS